MRDLVALLAVLMLAAPAGAADPSPAPAPGAGQAAATAPARPAPAASATKAPAAKSTKTKSTAAKKKPPATRATLELDWRELLPAAQRASYSPVAPRPVHDHLGEGGPPAPQVLTFEVNKELDGAPVRLPGFIVPIGPGTNGRVREFFLVPYLGACIHVPPPPPNQMVYVRSTAGVSMDSLHEAYWVTGKMRIEQHKTPLAASAYALRAEKIELYQY